LNDHNLRKVEGNPDMQKSIFPTFNVNVPMPSDTAVPGSYGTAAPQLPASNGQAGKAEQDQ
jgi:hypothetical protein